MLRITFELNGRPIDPRNIKDALEKAIVEGIRSDLEKRIRQAAGFDADKLTVKMSGSSLNSLSMNISGPDEVVAKVRKVFG